MALANLLNRVKVAVASAPGTGTIALGGAVAGFQSFASAGAPAFCLISYVIEDAGSTWEVGQGTYTASGTTLTRTTILSSSSGGAAITATSAALVSATALASDFTGTLLGGRSRNRLYNGVMGIDQQHAGATGTAGGYPVDGWFFAASQSAKLTYGQNLLSTAPPAGFSNDDGL
jgi:hypothetical protein